MHNKTIAELSKSLHEREFSSTELTQHFLERIKKSNPEINAFITVTEEQALADARAADEKLASGQAGSLTGIPIAHKDILCTKGIKTSCGSKMLDNFIAPYDATVVKKFKEAHMVMLGKTNCDEFAMGSSNETSFYGAVKNPHDLERSSGGSSGGSAAAVAAQLVPGATGTDTGGSIRQPASLTGTVGLKPTYGRVSRFGLIAFASSLDQAGLFAQTAEDIALMLNVMAGYDPQDSTSVDRPVPNYTTDLNKSIKGLRIGLPKEYFNEKLNSKIAEIVHKGAKRLESFGASLHDISLPNVDLAIPVYYVIAPAECSSNLARYDGVRYGYRCDDPKDLQDLYERSRSEGFGDEVKHRIMIGTHVLSSGYYDAYYGQAQKVRRLIVEDYQNAFEQVDVILSPTSPTTAFKLNSLHNDRVNEYLEDIFTVTANLAGLPAISIPAGIDDGLPVGMQLMGKHFDESLLLNVAHQFERGEE